MTYRMPLPELLSVFGVDSDSKAVVSGLALDSRRVENGFLFFACNGTATDGRDFMLAAQSAGAIAIVYEAENADLPAGLNIPIFPVFGLNQMVGYAASSFYKEPSRDLQVFGVTGTNGKSTCCYLLVQALQSLGMKAGMIGTIGVGDVEDLAESSLTTPDPISLQSSLAKMRDQGFTQIAIEVSSHALDQGRVNGTTFFCTLFTNLTRDHLDYHGDMDRYGAAKQRLFTDFHSELVITNAADSFGARLIDVANSEFIVQYGQSGDVFADDVVLGPHGIAMTIEGNGVEFDLQTPLIGKINVQNLEMLVATLLALSTSIEDIQKITSDLKPAPGRMERFNLKAGTSVVVDYAHTPDALEKALLSIREHCEGELWCVFGCGGDRDQGKRPVMGAHAARYADRLVVTNDNPRSESPQHIADQIVAGAQAESGNIELKTILDRREAIQFAVSQASESDWVLVAGKGHETTQTIGDKVLDFSDRTLVNQLLGLAGHSADPAHAVEAAQ